MKKIFGVCILAALLAGCAVQEDGAVKKPRWEENKFGVEIYEGRFDDSYEAWYLEDETGGVTERVLERAAGDAAYLLVVDGGFVPAPDIYTIDGMPYVPLESLEPMGIAAECGGKGDGYFVRLQRGKDTLLLLDPYRAEKNGEKIETEYSIVESEYGEMYVHICFVAEQFGGTAQFIQDFKKEICGDEKEYGLRVGMAVVEMPEEGQPLFTVEEGLAEVQKASLEQFNRMDELWKKTGKVFWRYDPMAVHYTGEDLGRYSVYKLEGFEKRPIFFNRYTGEIYGVQPRLQSILIIHKRFPNTR